MQRRYAPTAFLSLLVLAGLQTPVHGQLRFPQLPAVAPVSLEPEAPGDPSGDITRQREDIAQRLRVAQRELAAEKQNGIAQAPAAERLQAEVASLKQVEILLAQQRAGEERRKAKQKDVAELETRLNQLRSAGPKEEKPYSFLLLDQLRDQLVAETARKDAVEDTLLATNEAMLRAKAVVEEKERGRREAKEALDTSRDETAKPKLASILAQAELDSRLAQEVLKLRKIEEATEKLAQQHYVLTVTFLAEKAELVGQQTRFTNQDLQDQLLELDKQERDLQRQRQAAEASVAYLEQQWFEARKRLDLSTDGDPALTEEVSARQLARMNQQQAIADFGQQLARIEDRRLFWDKRLKILNDNATADQRDTWSEEIQQSLEQLGRERRLQVIRADEVRKDQTTLTSKIESDPQGPAEVVRWREEQQRQLADLLALHEKNIASIDINRRMGQKLLREIRDSQPEVTLLDHLADLWDSTVTIWNYELASIDDRPITVKKIVTGIILLFAGYVLSGLISRVFGGHFLPRVGVHPNAASTLQSILFYTLIVLFALFALKVVNMPLTAFTLLGGALALGVGFGSQNVINNFISGLILLAERSIKVGDLIQLDTLYGTVQHIGARSTRIETGANHEIIVPNSTFLENNVVNWTLSDDRIRTVVKVGVIYGSPTREVSKLLAKAVADHGLVLEKPEPIVLFTDFSDNSLNFEVHFWIRMRTLMDRLRIESDIRYRIDQLFREAGLVIAFPQRDVHLDHVKPIEVRLLPISSADQPQEPSESLAKSA